MNVLPALILIVCTEGHACSHPVREEFIMPDWETCFRAAQGASFNPVPDSLETGKRYEMSFVVSVSCGSVEAD